MSLISQSLLLQNFKTSNLENGDTDFPLVLIVLRFIS
jgi:hypothetical protein